MLKYNVVSSLVNKKNAQTGQIEQKRVYFARLVPVTPVKLAEFAEGISRECTVTPADIKAVLAAMEQRLVQYLRNGNSIRLGDLGSFRVTLSSGSVENAEEFSTANITGVNVRFHVSPKLKYELSLKHPYTALSRSDEAEQDDDAQASA